MMGAGGGLAEVWMGVKAESWVFMGVQMSRCEDTQM